MGLNNTGQGGGTPDADIDAHEAWAAFDSGLASVIVGVIDTGVDYTHEDLAANMWVNPGETPGNGLDDDGNGYIDDVHGINVITGSGDPIDYGHGTHVAGTIGAVGNNGIGVAGVNWDVSLVACKFLAADGYGTTAGAIECCLYIKGLQAAGNNIRLTNNSWGGGGKSSLLKNAMSGEILHVAAAGNGNILGNPIDNDDYAFYPSSYVLNNIISVAATDRNDDYASWSNYGVTSVDLAASGAAALIWAVDSSLSALAVKEMLLSGVDSLDVSNKTETDGRLNVFDSLDTIPPAAISGLEISGEGRSSLTRSWIATGNDGTTGTASSYDVRYSTSAITAGNWGSAS